MEKKQMSKYKQIEINDIAKAHLFETEFEELSNLELETIVGGKRKRYKYDTDGDGKWDVKIVER